MKRGAVVLVFLLLLMVNLPAAEAWWAEGHRLMTYEAIKLVPEEWRPFFEHYAYFLNETCNWPDTVFKSEDPLEEPRHYYDLEIPPDQRTYEDGALPYAVENFTREMADALARGDWYEALVNAGRVAHYVEDAHQPYHATVNYNPMGKHGLADSLVEKHWKELDIRPGEPQFIENLTAYMFDIIVDSNRKVARLNATLIGDPDDPSDDRDWSDDLRDLISEQASRAITAVASVWLTAIEMSGASPPDLSESYSLSVEITSPDNATSLLRGSAEVVDGFGIPVDADVRVYLGETEVTQVRRAGLGRYGFVIEADQLQLYAGEDVELRVVASREGYGQAEGLKVIHVAPAKRAREAEVGLSPLVLAALAGVLLILALALILRRR